MLERGDLLLIPSPFSDLSATKKRPVLALTRPDPFGDFIALPVTARLQTDNGIANNRTDLVQGSLPLASWIGTDRTVTLNASLAITIFGRASETLIAAALARLCDFIEHGGPVRP